MYLYLSLSHCLSPRHSVKGIYSCFQEQWQAPSDDTERSLGASRALRNHLLPQQRMKACRKWLIKDVHHLCFPGSVWRCWIYSSVTRLPAGIAASISHMKIVVLLSPLQTDLSFQYVVPSSSLFQSYSFHLVALCKISWP